MTNRAMKDSGVEWIGAIPEDWEILKYKRFAKSGMGSTLLKEDVLISEEPNSVPVYSATQTDKHFGYLQNPKIVLEKGDLVIPARGNSIGNTKIIKEAIATCTQTTIYSKLNNKIDNRFLYYCSIGLKEYWFFFVQTAIPQITVAEVQNNLVPFTSMKEQKKIAAYLDEKVAHIDNIIEDTKKSIENLKFYKQSLITETVTKGLDPNVEMKNSGIQWIGEIPKHWRVTKVKNFVQIKNGKDNKVKDGEIPVYGSGGVFGKTDQIMYEKASVLLGRKGTIDSPKYIEKPFWAVDTTFYTIAKPNVALKFFYYLMKSIDYKKYTYGSAIPSMSQSILNEIKLPYTNLDEQKQIAIFLDHKTSHVDSLIEQKEQLVAELESYKKSLIYEYVTGKKEVK